MKKGFTLVEFLIVVAIVSILMFLGFFFFREWIKAAKVEGDVSKIYQILKKYQLLAARERTTVYVKLIEPTRIRVTVLVNDTRQRYYYDLSTPFGLKDEDERVKINPLGIFSNFNSFYSLENTTATKTCVKVSSVRVCEGYWDGSDCICRY
jgi:prepilin-type N-terminal cleavage/methylation domain-containing protein